MFIVSGLGLSRVNKISLYLTYLMGKDRDVQRTTESIYDLNFPLR